MIKLYGGNEAFINKLDELFLQDSDIHRYIVDFLRSDGTLRARQRTLSSCALSLRIRWRAIQDSSSRTPNHAAAYDNTPTGICGNDDCGQLSAWYVWSAIDFIQ